MIAGLLRHLVLLGAMGILAGGCAKYQYVLVEPGPEQAIVKKQRTTLTREPLEYRLTQVEGRLGVRIANPTDEPIRLVENRSYLVTPDGESHPLRSGTIAPHSYLGLWLPPAPRVYTAHPSYPYGYYGYYGYGYWRRPYRYWGPYDGWGYYDPWFGSPTYYITTYPPGYWEWKTGQVRLHFAFERDDQKWEQELIIERRRVK